MHAKQARQLLLFPRIMLTLFWQMVVPIEDLE